MQSVCSRAYDDSGCDLSHLCFVGVCGIYHQKSNRSRGIENTQYSIVNLWSILSLEIVCGTVEKSGHIVTVISPHQACAVVVGPQES